MSLNHQHSKMVYSVQVKRLKHENPLDALIVRGTKRKRDGDDDSSIDSSNLVFRLAHTYTTDQSAKHIPLEPPDATKYCANLENTTSSFGGDAREPVFSISHAKRLKKTNHENSRPNRLENILEPNTTHRKSCESIVDDIPPELQTMIAEYIGPSSSNLESESAQHIDKETEDYVYDIYFSEQAGTVASKRIGYM